MKKIFEMTKDCCGCAACASICPQHCITMQLDEEGFAYPQMNTEACIQCGRCERSCPVLKEKDRRDTPTQLPASYAAYNKDEVIRLASSSGGIFTLLAEQTILGNGVVFGAAMGEDQRTVTHIAVRTMQELEKLRGSKYLQSNIEGIYSQVRTELLANRPVLFSGTPCQVEALRSFLGQDFENLLCVDLICHGVPSPKVWQKYLSYQENRAGAPARRTFFRHKKYGWKTFALSFEFSNDKVYEQIFQKDLFMQTFLRNACLRPSCHHCHFKRINRSSDITLADFWGIENLFPEMDDDKGISLVLIHTGKGQQTFDKLKDKLCFLPVNTEKALKGNSAMTCSAVPHKQRTKFFAMLDILPFDVLARRYAKPKYTAKGMAVALLHKIGMYKAAKQLYKRLRSQQ